MSISDRALAGVARSLLASQTKRGCENTRTGRQGKCTQKNRTGNGESVTTYRTPQLSFLFPAARALARGVARRRRKGDGCEEERGAHGTQHRLDGGGQLLHLVRARARVS